MQKALEKLLSNINGRKLHEDSDDETELQMDSLVLENIFDEWAKMLEEQRITFEVR